MTFPRVRSDPDISNWNSPLSALEMDYEGWIFWNSQSHSQWIIIFLKFPTGSEYLPNEPQQPNTRFGFSRVGRGSGSSLASRLYSRLGDPSQDTIKRGGPGGGAGMWFGPRLGRVQKRSPTKEHE